MSKKMVMKESNKNGYTLMFCEDPYNFLYEGLSSKYFETKEELEEEIAFWIDKYDLPEEDDVSHLFIVFEGELPEVQLIPTKGLKVA